MIVRLVSLRVDPERAAEFKKYFERLYDHIRAHAGCLFLQLVEDIQGQGDFFTISEWENAEVLEAYRTGSFFRSTWPVVKSFLREKAWAQTFHIVLDGDRRAEVVWQPEGLNWVGEPNAL